MEEKEKGAFMPPDLTDNVSTPKHHKDSNYFPVGQIVRVADDFFEKVCTPWGEVKWVPRKRKELEKDGCDFSALKKFKGWTNSPNFVEYKEEVNGWLNMSVPLPYTPAEGEWPTIRKLMQHIFGEQYEVGLDYYSLILTTPWQLLPILVLVSEEQGTGKSTLLQFNSMLIGANAVTMNVAQYYQQFNAVYAAKILIGVDETVFGDHSIKERIKQDSTAPTIQLRRMHTEHHTLPFFGKFILCTNRAKDFARLDKEDVRFWVRNVQPLQEYDPDFCTKLQQEVPAFAHFLFHRQLSVPEPLSRMWFSPEQLKTDALTAIVENSISDCAKDITIWSESVNRAEFGATEKDIWEELGKKYTLSQVRKALKEELKLPNNNKRFIDRFGNPQVGRAYIFQTDLPE